MKRSRQSPSLQERRKRICRHCSCRLAMSAGGVAQTAGLGGWTAIPQAGRRIATPCLGRGLDPPNRQPRREPANSAIPVVQTPHEPFAAPNCLAECIYYYSISKRYGMVYIFG